MIITTKEAIDTILKMVADVDAATMAPHVLKGDNGICRGVNCSDCKSRFKTDVYNYNDALCIIALINEWYRNVGKDIYVQKSIPEQPDNQTIAPEERKDRFQMIKELMSKSTEG